MDSDLWLRRYHPASPNGMRLVCFPHIGGAASFYSPLSAALTPEFDVRAVQYPGRQDRWAEPPATDIRALADAIAEALQDTPVDRLALFGHSMGTLVAFEVALRLERDRGESPAALVMSGMYAPSRKLETELLSGAPDDLAGAVEDLKRLRGTDDELLANEELLAKALPTIRADYMATVSYRCAPGAAVSCPITVLVGDSDQFVPVEAAQAWSEHTTGGFEMHVFGGGHFYLIDMWSAITGQLSDVLHASM